MKVKFKNQTVTIVQYAGSEHVSLIGPHGTAVLRNDNPVEIGITAMELLTGHKVCPPAAYRKDEEGEG
jgi:hypothetical protein